MIKNTLEKLTALPAMSGDEFEIMDFLRESIKASGLSIERDKLGSVIANKKGDSVHKLMLVTNVDEFGFIVKKWLSEGIAILLPISSFKTDLFLDRVCTVLDREHRKYIGYITKLNDEIVCYVNSNSIKLGDVVVCKQSIKWLDTDTCVGSQISNRANASILLDLMEQTKGTIETDFVFTPQSLVGSRAAVTSVTSSKPSLSIVLEAAAVENYQAGKVYIQYFDKGMLPSRRFITIVTEILESQGIEVVPTFSNKINDSSLIHKSLSGVPSMVMVLPLKHQSDFSQILDIKDAVILQDALNIIVDSLTDSHISTIHFGEI